MFISHTQMHFTFMYINNKHCETLIVCFLDTWSHLLNIHTNFEKHESFTLRIGSIQHMLCVDKPIFNMANWKISFLLRFINMITYMLKYIFDDRHMAIQDACDDLEALKAQIHGKIWILRGNVSVPKTWWEVVKILNLHII